MELTAAAEWLNATFANFDFSILKWYHDAAVSCGTVLTPFMEFISFLGTGGLFSLALGFILVLFKDTRKAGFCVLLAAGLGAVITNLTLKDAVARPRPYTLAKFKEWWQYVGAHVESDFSFPSGHVTAVMAGITGLNLVCKRRRLFLGYLFVIVMAASRNYLFAHYPTDICGGFIVGAVAGLLSYLFITRLYGIIESHKDAPFCRGFLNADIKNLFRSK